MTHLYHETAKLLLLLDFRWLKNATSKLKDGNIVYILTDVSNINSVCGCRSYCGFI